MHIVKSKQYLTFSSAADDQQGNLKQKLPHYYFVKLSAFENSPYVFPKSKCLIADLHYAGGMEKDKK
jgi:hypothetical protein